MAVFSFYMAVNFCCEAGRTPLAFEQVSISISISEMRLTMSIYDLLSSSSINEFDITKKKKSPFDLMVHDLYLIYKMFVYIIVIG